jgi:hypothetical protein
MAKLYDNDTAVWGGNPRAKMGARWQKKCWFYVPEHDITIGMAPKCGRSSFHALLGTLPYFQPVHWEGRCVFVVRNPLARIKSLWKNKCRDGAKLNYGDKEAYLAGWTMDQLLDMIEADQEHNHHWAQQAEIEGGKATELVLFERFAQWCKDEGLGTLPHKNKTEGAVELTDEQIKRVLRLYPDDVKLYTRGLREYNE